MPSPFKMKSFRLLQKPFLPSFRHAAHFRPRHSSPLSLSKTPIRGQQRVSIHTSTSPLSQLLPKHPSRSPSLKHSLSRRLKFFSTKPSPPPSNESLSLSQRFRKLSREYGWSALGVYLALSALDFPFCFLAVQWLGTDRIGHWEHAVLEWFWKVVPYPFPSREEGLKIENGGPGINTAPREEARVRSGEEIALAGYDHGVKEAEELNQSENASIWTQLALAYAIHKSFIFIRIPLAAAVTPKVVKVLRGWGWDIGKRRPRGSSKKP